MSSIANAEDILDGLEQPPALRPVIVTTHTTHVVWVDASDTTEGLNYDPCYLLDSHPPAVDGWIEVADPNPDQWEWAVYTADLGPHNAAVQGPWWECTPCGTTQHPDDSYPRRHRGRCAAQATDATATAGGGR